MQVLKGSCREEEEIEIWKVCKLSWKRQNLHVYLEQKGKMANRGECAARRRSSEAEADMGIRNWEQRNSDCALYETNRELESQRLELYPANQWADQAQREKMNLCGELEMRSRLFQESFARDCQEIEELRRICCEETDRARQLRTDELSMQQERNPTTVSQLTEQSEFLVRCEGILRSQPTLDYSEFQRTA